MLNPPTFRAPDPSRFPRFLARMDPLPFALARCARLHLSRAQFAASGLRLYALQHLCFLSTLGLAMHCTCVDAHIVYSKFARIAHVTDKPCLAAFDLWSSPGSPDTITKSPVVCPSRSRCRRWVLPQARSSHDATHSVHIRAVQGWQAFANADAKVLQQLTKKDVAMAR